MRRVAHAVDDHDALEAFPELVAFQHRQEGTETGTGRDHPEVARRRHPAQREKSLRLALDDGSLERAAGVVIAPEHTHVMLCGNPQMIEDMTTRLATRGLRKHRVRTPGHITIEKYW